MINRPNFRTLDLNLLRVFDEVMAERSLTRAARNLALSQPAVSNALRRLRETLGDDLVRRVRHGVEPTPLALQLWPTVRESLQRLRETLAPVEFNPAQAQDVFVLAMADATASKIMPGLVAILDSEAPNVTLRVLPLTTRDPRAWLESGEVHLAIGYFPGVLAELGASHLQEQVPRFHAQRLYQGRYVVAMRRGHPLAQAPLTLDDYCAARHLLVSFSGRPFGFVDEALAAISRRRRIVMTVNQFFTAGLVVATSDLLTVLPHHFLSSTGHADALAVQPLPIDVPHVHVDMLWYRQADSVSAQQWLRAAVVRAVADGAALPQAL